MDRVYNVNWTNDTYQLDWKAQGVSISLQSGASWNGKKLERTGPLSAEIRTHRLLIRSISEQDTPFFLKIFSDPQAMRLFAGGKVRPEEETTRRVRAWSQRWFKEQDPYSAMLVCKEVVPIGCVFLGHGDAPGVSEPAICFLPDAWGKGYGKEVFAALQECLFALKQEEFLLQGNPLQQVRSTVSKENTASEKLLQGIGMKYIGDTVLEGMPKSLYQWDIKIPESIMQEIHAVHKVSFDDHPELKPQPLQRGRLSRWLHTLYEWKAKIVANVMVFLSYLKGRLFKTA